MRLIDAHCHVDLYPSYSEIIAESVSGNIHIVAMTNAPAAFKGNVQRARGVPSLQVALGIHPQIVGTKYADLTRFETYLQEATMIGEVGLDASPAYYRTFDEQKDIFGKVVSLCAEMGGKPVSVHSVRAARAVLKIVQECDAQHRNRYALHWFTGSAAELKNAVDLGCYFSVNQAMIRSTRGCELLANIPRNLIITETDGPFVQNSGEPARPSMVRETVVSLARMWGVATEDALSTIDQTFRDFSSI
ncbi:MAG: Qat anti-phage system TatD family nuclease QatD [Acidobacteriaceae bacterium]